MAVLIVQEKGGLERRMELKGDRCSIGKKADNDLVLDRPSISREHCLIQAQDGAFIVRDLNSRNGTYVDGRRIDSDTPLTDGCQIQLGDFRIIFRNVPPQAAGKRPAAADKHDAAARRTPVDLKRKLHQEVLDRLDLKHTDLAQKSHEEIWDKAAQAARAGIVSMRGELPAWLAEETLIKDVIDEAVGLGPIEDLLDDDTVDEIMVNGWDKVYVERGGKIQLTNKQFISDDQVLTVIRRILAPLGRRIDESNPMVDARLKDGSRVNAITHPLSLTGPTLTIRKFGKERLTIDDLIRLDSMDAQMAEFLRMCVAQRRNISVSGGTGSGKTTLLNALSASIPETERIVTIEDAAELKLDQDHVVRLESKPPNIEGRGEIPIRKLVINALRMRPDRIVVGECRGSEALDMLQAMNTGHDGSLTTIHANSVRDSLSRLETMVMMAGMELPSRAIRSQIASAIHIFAHTARMSDGTRKVVHVAEMTGMEADTFVLQDLYVFKQTGFDGAGRVLGYHTALGSVPRFVQDLRERGVKVDLGLFAPRKPNEESR